MKMQVLLSLLCVCIWQTVSAIHGGMLFPKESESRQIQELGGMWDFRADSSPSRSAGMDQKWFKQPLRQTGAVIPMPVPSSYNDITADKALRDFVGWVWYDREFFVSPDWSNKRVVLRVESAHYNAIVWLNGEQVLTHEGGHLPFEGDVSHNLVFGKPNYITIAVNNTLSPHTLPPGTLSFGTDTKKYPPGYFVQNLQFDFFNYAGIHRLVRLYTTPHTYVDDITIKTKFTGTTGAVDYEVKPAGKDFDSILVEALDKDGQPVGGTMKTTNGTILIPNVHPWWPYTMNKEYGYQYTLKVTVMSKSGTMDVYRQRFGVRTVSVSSTQLLINNKAFYCLGVDKHEDSDIRGKGLDLPLIARDFSMLKWLGVNCFRTSHYPYAEEIMDQADAQGIVVIDECPGVGIKTDENFSQKSLDHHLEVMEELVRRDKNRPSAIMWSVANEPNSANSLADHYFGSVINHTHSLDSTRLVTFVADHDFKQDLVAKYTDVQCINRYYGWYSDTGHIEVIHYQLTYDLDEWYAKLQKPLIVSEYGADTIPGLHTMPSFVFTEDYQLEFMKAYHEVFDELRPKYLVGEMVWNFADFMTVQTDTRVVGNKKGLLTRQRQPKMAARLLRERYWSIINETGSVVKPRRPWELHCNSLHCAEGHDEVLGGNYP